MFALKESPKDMGSCSCEDFYHGNRPWVESNLSPGLTAMIQGWDAYCTIKDYDEIAKEEMTKEKP